MPPPHAAAPSRKPQMDSVPEGPLALYRARRAAGALLPDPAQELAVFFTYETLKVGRRAAKALFDQRVCCNRKGVDIFFETRKFVH